MTDDVPTIVPGPGHLIWRLFCVGFCTIMGTMLLVVLFLAMSAGIGDGWQGLALVPVIFAVGLALGLALLVAGVIPSAIVWAIALSVLAAFGMAPPLAWHAACGITAFIIAVAFQLYFRLADFPITLEKILGEIGVPLALSFLPAIVAVLFSIRLLPDKVRLE